MNTAASGDRPDWISPSLSGRNGRRQDGDGFPRMTDSDYARKQAELEQVLNDPAVPIRPDRVWYLLAELAAFDRVVTWSA
jgi:hypothetical protein